MERVWCWAWALMLAYPDVPTGSAIAFRLLGGQTVVVSARVNGRGPFDFVLDTGTTTTLIERGLAEQLALDPLDGVQLVTTSGSRVVPRSRLGCLSLGEIQVAHLTVLVSDLVGPRSASESIRGILGQNFLERFNYLLDYERRQIVFVGEAPPGQAGIRLAFERNQGRILVPAQAGGAAGARLRLVLDSGAGALILFEGPWEIERSYRNPLAMRTGSARRLRRSGWLKVLRMGDHTLRDLPVALLTDADRGEGRVEQGLLPTLLFRSVYFNNREGFVILRP